MCGNEVPVMSLRTSGLFGAPPSVMRRGSGAALASLLPGSRQRPPREDEADRPISDILARALSLQPDLPIRNEGREE